MKKIITVITSIILIYSLFLIIEINNFKTKEIYKPLITQTQDININAKSNISAHIYNSIGYKINYKYEKKNNTKKLTSSELNILNIIKIKK